ARPPLPVRRPSVPGVYVRAASGERRRVESRTPTRSRQIAVPTTRRVRVPTVCPGALRATCVGPWWQPRSRAGTPAAHGRPRPARWSVGRGAGWEVRKRFRTRGRIVRAGVRGVEHDRGPAHFLVPWALSAPISAGAWVGGAAVGRPATIPRAERWFNERHVESPRVPGHDRVDGRSGVRRAGGSASAVRRRAGAGRPRARGKAGRRGIRE